MSKRLGNAVDPFGVIQQYGSDPLRWYMITNANPWENIRFDTKGVEEVSRKYFGTLYNTYQFFALYGNLDGFDSSLDPIPYAERPEIDRWIISRLNSLIKEVDRKFSDYDLTPAGRAIESFVTEHLSNWYVRLSRKRFWAGSMTKDKLGAYQTLYRCLSVVAQLMAPIAPFYADRLYRDLHEDTCSVHLSTFPVAEEELIDLDLERSMELAQIYSTLVLSLRRKVNIKVRQPLGAIMLPVNNAADKDHIEQVHDLLLSEVNVKEIRFVDPSDSIWVRTVKPDFKALGPKVGKQMKALATQISQLTPAQISELEQSGEITLTVGDQSIVVSLEDVQIIAQDIPGWTVANEGSHTVALDITLTPELIAEGTAREFVNRIQNLRKQLGYEVNDHIELLVMAPEEITRALRTHQEYIQTQVQADTVDYPDLLSDAEEIDLDGAIIAVQISKQ
jgi:isoleucine--tRNA ligase